MMKKFKRWLVIGDAPEPKPELSFMAERLSARYVMRTLRGQAIEAVVTRAKEKGYELA